MSKPCSSDPETAASRRRDRSLEAAVVLAAAAVAAVSARPFAVSANDSSRLATVQCLVDYHTLAIDQSIWFEQTCDKIRPRPDGPFYSHQPPTLSLMLAVPYLAAHDGLGLRAADHRDVFCYLMALLCSGISYVAAVWCVYRLGRTLDLSPGWSAALTASFGLATVAPVYACHVNSHLPTLAAATAVVLNVAALARSSAGAVGRLLLIGALAGFTYALDQPTGGLLLAAAAGAAALRLRQPSAVVWVALAALPWAVVHHAVAYSYTGMLGPAAANPAFWDYPGSQFNASNLTGLWTHAGLGAFAVYAFLLLFGVHGFVLSNPTLLLGPVAGWHAFAARRSPCVSAGAAEGRESMAHVGRVETVCFGLWCLGVWLLYAALSNNYGGFCCSIRWFVPLLAPGYYWLALLLRDLSQYRIDFVLLSVWGAALTGYFWYYGPFGEFDAQKAFPYVFWSVQAGCLLSWAGWCVFAATRAARRQ
jgi:hypothetical protein